jgi:hypothetical protein
VRDGHIGISGRFTPGDPMESSIAHDWRLQRSTRTGASLQGTRGAIRTELPGRRRQASLLPSSVHAELYPASASEIVDTAGAGWAGELDRKEPVSALPNG